MDGFSYTNIFDTKGIEYIIIIVFLLLLIPFWYILNKRKPATVPARKPLARFSPDMPLGFYLSRNHAWAYLESSGVAKTGLDNFLLRITGKLKLNILLNEGDVVKKGDIIAEATMNGRKLKISSPLSGTIREANASLNGEVPADDPYNDGWIYRMTPSDWKSETRSFLLGEETRQWLNHELQRFRDMVAGLAAGNNPGVPVTVLQDGGEIAGHPLAEMNDEAWTVFEKSFLTLEAGNE